MRFLTGAVIAALLPYALGIIMEQAAKARMSPDYPLWGDVAIGVLLWLTLIIGIYWAIRIMLKAWKEIDSKKNTISQFNSK